MPAIFEPVGPFYKTSKHGPFSSSRAATVTIAESRQTPGHSVALFKWPPVGPPGCADHSPQNAGLVRKLENLQAAVALYVCWFNGYRKRRTIGSTPAPATGRASPAWPNDQLIPKQDTTHNRVRQEHRRGSV